MNRSYKLSSISKWGFTIFSVVYLSFIPNQTLSFKIIAIVNSLIAINEMTTHTKYSYSLHMITNLFVWIFFILANAMQYSTRTIVTSLPISFDASDYEKFQYVVFFLLVSFNVFYHWNQRRLHQHTFNLINNSSLSKKRLLLISFVSLVLTVFYFRSNYTLMFVRGVEGAAFGSLASSQMSALLIGKTIRCIPTVCLILALINNTFKRTELIILFFFMLLSVFPTSLPRNAIALYWLPILLISFKVLQKDGVLVIALFFAFFMIFPLFDIFRNFEDGTYVDFGFNLEYLNTMNFDASQEFMAVQKWDIVTYGKQLLGVLLFFVPRSIWPNKAVGSGYMVADTYGVFGNISMPWWGEGYVNFGYVGVFLFSIVLGVMCSRCDFQYWARKRASDAYSYNDGMYLLLLGAITFILRGDLLSSFSSTIGTIVTYYFTLKFCSKHQ